MEYDRRPEAAVVVCKCKESHSMFGVRFEKKNGIWTYDWAYKMKETTARHEGYDKQKILGEIRRDPEYPGCPYCKSMDFVICGCGKLTCYAQQRGLFTCEWCGSTGEITAYTGFGFGSQGDR